MKAAVQFEVEAREQTGKGAARAARRKGFVPVNLYANGKPNVNLNVEGRAISNEYFRGGFMNKIVSFKLAGKEMFALARDIQLNPVTDKIEHADFLAIDEKSVVKVSVPVHFLNADKSVGIKRGGVLNIVRHKVELLSPVASIPAAIEIDVATLDIGGSIHTNDIALPQGVTPATKRNLTIASIAGRSKEEEETPTSAPAAGAVPASTAKAPEGAAAGGKDAKPAAKK